MGERDGIARANAKPAATGEVVDRPRDDPEADSVQLAEKRGDLARKRTVDEGLEEDRFGPVLALVHGDELGEHGVRALTARAPSLDPSDQALGAPPQRGVDETFLRRRVQVDRSRRYVSPSRDFADAELRVPAPSHLAQGRGLDRARRSGSRACAFALDVSPIHYTTSVSE